MKKSILFLSYTDDGGAGKANVNMAKALLSLGNDVQFLVVNKTSSESFITEVCTPKNNSKANAVVTKLKNRLGLEISKLTGNRVPHANFVAKYYYNDNEQVSAYDVADILPYVAIKPDIVVGGWISYFINFETLGKIAEHYNALAYVLMNDMAHLTGGCHYNWGCHGYQTDCSSCPALTDIYDRNKSKINLKNKQNSIQKYNIEVIAGSEGNVVEAKSSTLFTSQKEIKKINGILNFDLLNPKKRNIAKEVFDIPTDRKVILAGSSYINDPRKGFIKLQKVLAKLNEKLVANSKEVTLIIVGKNNVFDFNFPNIKLLEFDTIVDNLLFSLLYQAADVYVSPSIEDTGPAMVVEALASGTPVIGFQLGFVKDFVHNEKNGYIIPDFNIELFSEKIYDLLYILDSQLLQKNSVDSVKEAFSPKQFENFF